MDPFKDVSASSAASDPEQLGIDALGFLAGNPDLMERFLETSGLNAMQLRAEAAKPAFFVNLFDFILANENDVVAFADGIGVSPSAIGWARNKLAVKVGIAPEDYPS